MTKLLNRRISSLLPSPTMAISARATELRKQGKDVISLAAGEPDFATPEHIVEAATRAMKEGKTTYTAAGGIAELRHAVAEYLNERLDASYGADHIAVSPGGKYALFGAFQVLLEPRDEVVIPAPYWVSFPAQVRLAGGEPVIVSCSQDNGFMPRASDIEAEITDRTRAIILNSPNNPTGAVYDDETLSEIADLVDKYRDRPIWLITDETYDQLVFDGNSHRSPLQQEADIYDRCLLVGSMSKTFAMTGWRVGYVAGPKDVVTAVSKLQSHSTSNVNTPAQWASVAALQGPTEQLGEMREVFQHRRDYLVEALDRIPGFSCTRPGGAFYAFPSVNEFLSLAGHRLPAAGSVASSADVARWLLDEAQVALVPGEGFGSPGFLRFSYATSMENLESAVERIEAAVSAIVP